MLCFFNNIMYRQACNIRYIIVVCSVHVCMESACLGNLKFLKIYISLLYVARTLCYLIWCRQWSKMHLSRRHVRAVTQELGYVSQRKLLWAERAPGVYCHGLSSQKRVGLGAYKAGTLQHGLLSWRQIYFDDHKCAHLSRPVHPSTLLLDAHQPCSLYSMKTKLFTCTLRTIDVIFK